MTGESQAASATDELRRAVPKARCVAFDAPWNWLAAGWRDMWAMPHVSLAYGVIAAAGAGGLIAGLLSLEATSLFLALAGGFLLIGPMLAVGLYEASRRFGSGENVRIGDVVWAWFNARGQLGFLGAILLFVFMVWVQLALLLLMLFLGSSGLPPPSEFMRTLLFTQQGLGLLVVGTIVGGLLATLVFAIAALAVPMLMVREVDAITAARASLTAVALNPKPMALWAGLIVVLMGAGFVTLLAGLVVTFPLIGHATWHAYADIFGEA